VLGQLGDLAGLESSMLCFFEKISSILSLVEIQTRGAPSHLKSQEIVERS
jgi:hypothetical protein